MKLFISAQWVVLTVLFIGAVSLAVYTYTHKLPAEIAEDQAKVAVDVLNIVTEVIVPREVTVAELRPLLIQRIGRICEYTNSYPGTYQFVDSSEVVHELFGAGWLDWASADGRMEVTAVIPGTVYASLDLDNIEITSTSITGQVSARPTAQVTIRMAHALIDPERPCELDHSSVNFFRPEVHHMDSEEQRDSLISLWNKAMLEAKTALVTEARNSGLITETEANFKEDIEALLTELGFIPDVTIEFTGRGTSGTSTSPSAERTPQYSQRAYQVGR